MTKFRLIALWVMLVALPEIWVQQWHMLAFLAGIMAGVVIWCEMRNIRNREAYVNSLEMLLDEIHESMFRGTMAVNEAILVQLADDEAKGLNVTDRRKQVMESMERMKESYREAS